MNRMSVMSTPRRADARRGRATTEPIRRRRRNDRLGYALVAPLMLLTVGLVLVPAGYTLTESFFTVNALDPPTRFSGLRNFHQLFEDPVVRTAAANTILYVVIGVAMSTILGIMMAVILQRRFFGRAVVIAVLIVPWALPAVVEGIVWSGIYDPNVGLVNSVLSSMHLITHYNVLLGHNRLLTIALIELVQVWQITPLSTLLVLTALQVIPEELYEAARLDGCSAWGCFRRITLLLARPGIAIAMVQAVISTLNSFDQAYVLNGAASAAAPLTEETYLITFQHLNFGNGYALSLFITVLTVFISVVVVKAVYRRVEF